MTEKNENESSEINSEKEKLREGAKLHGFHLLIIALSFVLTFGAWYFSDLQLKQKNEEKFLRQADLVVELIKERMQLYENALWGGVALIDTQKGEIFYDQWLSYTNSLKIDQEYPGINGIGVIFNVQKNELDDYLTKERTLRPDYKVHPSHIENEYWPITYIEPAGPNAAAVGLDMAFEVNRYTSVKAARDTGTAQVTGPITLVQDAKSTPGFLFYTPFYENGFKPQTIDKRRETIVGVTYAPFIMQKLMQGTLARQNRQLRVNILDGNDLLYDDSLGDNRVDTLIDQDPLFQKTVDVEMYGRIWTFNLETNITFRNASNFEQPYYILFGGVIIDLLIILLFVYLVKANKRGLAYADRITESLEKESERLKKSNQVKSQFLSTMSHELRTPLTSIQGTLGLIKSGAIGKIPEEVSDLIEVATKNTKNLTLLVNDILDIEKFDEKMVSFDLTYIYVENIIKEAVQVNEPYAKNYEKYIISELETPNLILKTDGKRLEQVFTNLLSNGIKYSPPKKDVIIRSKVINNVFRVEVVDQGPGIPKEFQDKIFDRFTRSDNSDTREKGGTGLGLNICKEIIDGLGGRIDFVSEEGSGTIFFVEFDLPKGLVS